MNITVNLKPEYMITLERGASSHIADYINLNRKVMLIADENVPENVVQSIMNQIKNVVLVKLHSGEASKSFSEYERICATLLNNNFHREDLIIALGGGVTGDLSGFAAATYMRGIDFINIPTTTLSQIDSSIGGKTAINLAGTKNIIGAFHQPAAVIIDTELLKSLPLRQFNNGLIEALKAGLIYDKKLYEIFLKEDIALNLEEILYRSLIVKKQIVETDEKETGLRKILNFGHTVGHAVETLCSILHGEAVAIGMLAMIEDSALKRDVKNIINNKLGINTDINFDADRAFEIMLKDKKASARDITLVKVKSAGEAFFVKEPFDKCRKYLEMSGE